jgi:hypothetical protein
MNAVKAFVLVVSCALTLMVGVTYFSACGTQQVCPPAQLATINARYIEAAAQVCAGTPPSECPELPTLKAKRLAEEKDAGCL